MVPFGYDIEEGLAKSPPEGVAMFSRLRTSLPHAVRGVLIALALFVLALPFQSQNAQPKRLGLPSDWSHRYLMFGKTSSKQSLAAAQADQRYWQQQVRMSPQGLHEARAILLNTKKTRADWSVNLGGGGSVLAPGMYPAKYTFRVNAAPDCTNDYVVYALNVAGSASQATIVAYNNLYTEPGGTGYCAGTGPTVKWAYNTGGAINTSPSLSIDGTKVVWVATANPPVLHVLKIGTTGSNGASVTSPATAGTGNNAVDTAVSFGSVGDTRSSPFVDYTHDVAYVASDDGVMHKFSGILRGTPAEVSTGGWPLHIIDSGNHKIAGPIFDYVSKNLYYDDDIGTFTYIREVGSTVGVCIGQPSPPCWGQVTFSLTSGGNSIIESPVVDSTGQKVYIFIGNDNQGLGHARVLQSDTSLTLNNEATVGVAGQGMFSGAFNHNYFSSPQTGFLYVCGYPLLGLASPVLYRFSFDSTGKMSSSHDSNSLALASVLSTTRCSPITEFYNSGTGKDWLFLGVQAGCPSTGGSACILSLDVTSGFPSAVSAAQTEVGGTSGIVVDNVSLLPQASSIYFTTLNATTCGDGNSGGGCAVKLTQGGLN